MTRTFIEIPLFTKRWSENGLTEADLRQLQIMLLKDPESGPVIEGTGGIRKVRFPLENRGEIGSVRVGYTDFADYEVTYLITAFTRKEQENLSDVSTLFDDLQEGLLQAIDYANGKGSARTVTYTIDPVIKLNKDQIRDIRMQARMTQNVFADYLGVSVKTVEAWECGRTRPTGPACRLISLLAKSQIQSLPFISAEYNSQRQK